MRKLLFIIFLVPALMAYEEGESLNQNMVSHLGLEKNTLYVLDFFASWCGSCQKEIPLISKANAQNSDKNVVFIGIDVDKQVDKGIAFQKQLRAAGDLNFKVINDPQNLIISDFNPKGMPTLYFIKDAKVLKITTGAVDNIDTHILDYIKGVQE